MNKQEGQSSCLFLRSRGCVSRQVGQGEISIHQDEDEVMNQLVVGAFFLHPDEGLSISKEWIQVCNLFLNITYMLSSVQLQQNRQVSSSL